MAQNITLLGASYSNVPAVDLPKTGGGTATFTDVTDTTATAADVASGKYFYTSAGVKTEGTASGSAVIAVSDETDAHGGTIRHITGVSLLGDTVTADTLLQGVTAHAQDGTALTGTYVAPTPKTASDVTVSGATVTIPAGAYASQVQKSVATGTAGTPTASKGTVSNHSVSVTPSVTNVTGYISGGTKTGTAVTVSASELVSGSQTITSNGTTNVTNLASVTVAIPIVTYYTGSSAPSSSLGSNGDIYLQTS